MEGGDGGEVVEDVDVRAGGQVCCAVGVRRMAV